MAGRPWSPCATTGCFGVACLWAWPLVVNRSLLWGAACSCSVVVNLINIAVALSGLNLLGHAPALVGSSLAGILVAVLLILAFVPLPSYVRLVEGRTAEG